jgi:hypothetical protein
MVPGEVAEAGDSGRNKKWLATPTGWARANVFFEKSGKPRAGTLEESLMIAVWNRQREVQYLLETAKFLAPYDAKKASEYFNNAMELAFPKGGDIRALAPQEKQVVEFMNKMAGKAFSIKKAPDWTRVKSRLAGQRKP